MNRSIRMTLGVMLLTVAVGFAAASVPGTAWAQESAVTVETEGGDPCNPCIVHLVGESIIFSGVVALSRCHEELAAHLYTGGTGELEWAGTADGGPGCNAANCSSPENHWPILGVGETSPNTAHMTIGLCFNGTHCDAEAAISEPATHAYTFSMNHTCPSGHRIAGSWAVEDSPIELHHVSGPGTAVAVKTEDDSSCNPCVIHAGGESSIFYGPMEVLRCHDEFTIRLFATTGEVEWVGNTDGGAGCPLSCAPPENHWPLTSLAEVAANTVVAILRLCHGGGHCNAQITIAEPSTHRYDLSTNHTCPSGARFTGSWTVEEHPVEFDHTP